MNADRIHVLHAADGNDIADLVTHDFKFDLFPAGNGTLNQYLSDGRKIQTVLRNTAQLSFIRRAAAAGTTQRVSRADNDRIADLFRNTDGFLHCGGDTGGDHGLADRLHGFLEKLSVLRLFNGFGIDADEPDTVFFQKTVPVQFHGERQTGLSTQARQHAVRLFLLDNAAKGIDSQRLQIDLISESLIRHNRRGIGIDKNNFNAFPAEDAARLSPRIVELGGLADHDRAGTDHQYFSDR